ncbi:MAG: hypothetical protein ABJB74_16320 [Gemmatimonas sp.]
MKTSPLAARSRWYAVIALSLPLLLFAAIEGAARLFWRDGALPLFITAPIGQGRWLKTNAMVAARWFPELKSPPSPNVEFLLAQKPRNGFRVIVLGESAAQGFPYPRSGSFAQLLHAALTDALPGREVEVVTIGIAATNSYAMLDVVDEVIKQHPDAVLYYGGHNEYVGALGAGSSIRLAASPSLTRFFVRLQHLRSVRMVNRIIAQRLAKRAAARSGPMDSASVGLMESITDGGEIALNSRVFDTGRRQYEENLTRIVDRLRDAKVPVYVASTPSNVRDQPPFAAAGNGPARAAFAEATAALARGDSASAHTQFLEARDRDVIRFRAPTAFDSVVRRVAHAAGASQVHYVPIVEAFAAHTAAGAPGTDLFLEHVHPNRLGTELIAASFWTALRAAPPSGVVFDTTRVRSMATYERASEFSAFDERIAYHRVQALAVRWPFVPVNQQGDYRGRYVPTDRVDSLAFLVSAGVTPWELGKLNVARYYDARGDTAAAVAEYVGLARDQFMYAEPQRLAGAALFRAGRLAEADSLLAKAMLLEPTTEVALVRARIAGRQQNWPLALALLTDAARLEPNRADVMYQLSLAQSLVGDARAARATALQLARLHPQYPPLKAWLVTLGISP